MKVTSFGKIGACNSAPITADLDWWTPISATAPTMKTFLEKVSDDGKFLTGFWECTPGTYRVVYPGDEMVYMFEGKVIVTADGEAPKHYSAGDSFFIESGFSGTWETIEAVRKTFAIRIA